MKKHYITKLILFSSIMILAACQNETDYKMVRKQVLDQHDRIMFDGERAMNNKMKLDTLGMSGLAVLKKQKPTLDTALEHKQIQALSKKLTDADDLMNDWMHNFKSDVGGKSNEEAVKYFNEENVKVNKLDSIYKAVLKETDTYLKKLNIKPDTTMKSMNHMKM